MAAKYSCLLIVVSDSVSAGGNTDVTGPCLAEAVSDSGFDEPKVIVVPDGVDSVANALNKGLTEGYNLICTAGGTGFGPRDLTPEGTKNVIVKSAPGLAEAMRLASPRGLGRLNRGVCGTVGSTLILNLPGSPKGSVECFEAVADVLDHVLDLLNGQKPH